MKFSTNKGKFETIIASMQPFLEKKDSSAITSHIYIEISNSLLILKSTDYEIFSIDGKFIKKGISNPDSEINISTLVKGTYVLKFSNQSVKLIKE